MIGHQESPHRSTHMFFFTLCIHISKSRASNCRRALSTIKVARPKPLTLRRGPSTSKNTPAECAYKFCYETRSYGLFFVLPPRSRPKCPVLYIWRGWKPLKRPKERSLCLGHHTALSERADTWGPSRAFGTDWTPSFNVSSTTTSTH